MSEKGLPARRADDQPIALRAGVWRSHEGKGPDRMMLTGDAGDGWVYCRLLGRQRGGTFRLLERLLVTNRTGWRLEMLNG